MDNLATAFDIVEEKMYLSELKEVVNTAWRLATTGKLLIKLTTYGYSEYLLNEHCLGD